MPALAIVLRRQMTALGRPAAAIGLVTIVALLNTGVFRSVHWGHPEEFLAGALCVGAVLAALRDRAIAAALLLGLAVATKQWAVIAIVPVLLAAAGAGSRLALVGTDRTRVHAADDPARARPFVSVHKDAVRRRRGREPAERLVPVRLSAAARRARRIGSGFLYEIPARLAMITHPAIVLLGIPLGALFWRRRHLLRREDALGLLALSCSCAASSTRGTSTTTTRRSCWPCWPGRRSRRDGWPRLTVLAGARWRSPSRRR